MFAVRSPDPLCSNCFTCLSVFCTAARWPIAYLPNSARTRHPADSLKEPHCGAGFAEGGETSCLTLAMHRHLLNHLKHVTGSRYAAWCSGPCASASTSFLDLRVSSTFSLCGKSFGTSAPILLAVLSQLFCHTGLLRELFLPAVGYDLVSWVLGSQHLAVLLMGSRVPIPGCFAFLHGHLARVSFNQIQ